MSAYKIPLGHDTVMVNEQNIVIRSYKYVKPAPVPKKAPPVPLALPRHDQ
jgi:hypothetical protein